MANRSQKSPKVITIDFRNRITYNAAEEREANIMGKRIAKARRKAGLSQEEMCELLADAGILVQKAGLSKWEKGTTVPNIYQMVAISRVLRLRGGLAHFDPCDDLKPALNEIGLKKVDEYTSDLVASGRYSPHSAREIRNAVEMQVSAMPTSAGTGCFLDDERFETISFPEGSVPSAADFGIRVSGDSMEPVYHDGQIVWVQKCSELMAGEVGIFIYDGEGYVKALGEQEPEEDVREEFVDCYGGVRPQMLLVSYNEKYKPIVVSPHKELIIVGRVL